MCVVVLDPVVLVLDRETDRIKMESRIRIGI
jgi:hypothetical protein